MTFFETRLAILGGGAAFSRQFVCFVLWALALPLCSSQVGVALVQPLSACKSLATDYLDDQEKFVVSMFGTMEGSLIDSIYSFNVTESLCSSAGQRFIQV